MGFGNWVLFMALAFVAAVIFLGIAALRSRKRRSSNEELSPTVTPGIERNDTEKRNHRNSA